MLQMALLAGQGILAGLGAFSQGAINRAKIEAENTINTARAGAENRVRDATNAFTLASNQLTRTNQRLSNARTMEAVGAQLEAQARTYARQQDVTASMSFEDSIREAEQAGEQAVGAAFSGVTGDAVDVIAGTTLLRQARQAELRTRQLGQTGYDATEQRRDIVAAGVGQLDQGSVLDSIDYGISVANIQRSGGNGTGAAIMSFLANGGLQAGLGAYGQLMKPSAPAGGGGLTLPKTSQGGIGPKFSFAPTESWRIL